MSNKVVTEKIVTPDGEVRIMWDSTSYVFKTPFNHDTSLESSRTGYLETMPSKAQQNQADEADINTIVKRFNVTGQLPQIPLPPRLEEFGEIFDFQSAMNTMAAAKASFNQLPAEVRSQFNNDPHAFVSYTDAALEAGDLELLRKWGLAVPAPAGAASAPNPPSGGTPAPTAPTAS